MTARSILFTLLLALVACGGGGTYDCEAAFVGPLQPGQQAPTCEVTP